MGEKSPARIALETAHTGATLATGRLALILESGRGLTPGTLREIAAAFSGAAQALLTLNDERKAA